MMIGIESHGLKSKMHATFFAFSVKFTNYVQSVLFFSFSFNFSIAARISLLLKHSLEMQSDKHRAIARLFRFEFFLIVPCRCSMNTLEHRIESCGVRVSKFDCPHFDKCVQKIYFLHLFFSFSFILLKSFISQMQHWNYRARKIISKRHTHKQKHTLTQKFQCNNLFEDSLIFLSLLFSSYSRHISYSRNSCIFYAILCFCRFEAKWINKSER